MANCFARLALLSIGFLLSLSAAAQKIEYSEEFLTLAERANLMMMEPYEAGFRTCVPPLNDYLNCQHAICSEQKNLEIRYYIVPWDSTDERTMVPHVLTMQVLVNVAQNSQEALIFSKEFNTETLENSFHADWGFTYFCKPKPGFSLAQDCRIIVISRTGMGTIFMLTLFDDPNNPALDLYKFPAYFEED